MSESDDNAGAIRRGYAAMRRGDVESLIASCDPEIRFVSLVGQVEGHDYVGHDGIRKFIADLREVWEVWLPQEESVVADGDTVLVTGTTKTRGKGSGVEIEIEWGQVFRMRNGKVLWSRIYSDRDEARKEAGLGP